MQILNHVRKLVFNCDSLTCNRAKGSLKPLQDISIHKYKESNDVTGRASTTRCQVRTGGISIILTCTVYVLK